MTTYYRPPSPFRVRIINPLVHFLVSRFGFGSQGEQDLMRILRVQGRISGRLYDVPLRIAVRDGQRYILSMLGESQWARNLRVVDMAQLIVGTLAENVRAYEITGPQKSDFLLWYCQHPEYELRARYALKVDTQHLTPAELERIAALYPLFHLESIPPISLANI